MIEPAAPQGGAAGAAELLQQQCRLSRGVQPCAIRQVALLELVRGASEAIVSGAITLLVLCAAASSPLVIEHTPNLQPSVQQQPGQRSGPPQAPAGTR